MPLSLVKADLDAGRLVRPLEAGPDHALDVRLIRLADGGDAGTLQAWEALVMAADRRGAGG